MEKDKINELNTNGDKKIYNNQEDLVDLDQIEQKLSQRLDDIIKDDTLNIVTMNDDNKVSDSVNSPKEIQDKGKNILKKGLGNIKKVCQDDVHISLGNLIFPICFLIGSVIYLELMTHILIYRSISFKIIYPILFAILR